MNGALAAILTVAGVVVVIFAFALLFLAWAATGRAREAFAFAGKVTAGVVGLFIVVGGVLILLSIIWSGVDA